MKTSLFIGSLLFLLLPFSIYIISPAGGGDNITTYSGFFYGYVDSPVDIDDNPTWFEPDWIDKEDVYGGYFGQDTWVLGLIALLLGVVALIAAIIDVHRLQGLLLVIAGILVIYCRYVVLDDQGIDYPVDETPFASLTDIPVGFIIGLIFGLISLRSSDKY
ncbi:MAG: hypothetical protein ACW98K_08100 [Candidatus Kariarchaeaceae archaeon]|jgi:hypothetical protein